MQIKASISFMRVSINRFEPFRIKQRGTTDDSVYFIIFAKQPLSEERTVLTGNTSYQSSTHGIGTRRDSMPQARKTAYVQIGQHRTSTCLMGMSDDCLYRRVKSSCPIGTR